MPALLLFVSSARKSSEVAFDDPDGEEDAGPLDEADETVLELDRDSAPHTECLARSGNAPRGPEPPPSATALSDARLLPVSDTPMPPPAAWDAEDAAEVTSRLNSAR